MSENVILPAQSLHPQDSRAPEIPFDFNKEFEVFKSLQTDFEAEVHAVKVRRELRNNRKNVAELRQQKILLPDETIIPDRTIEQNCQSEITPYITFTETPEDILGFFDPANPGFNFAPYQSWVTSLLREEEWQKPWQFMQDCMVLHGAGFFEVIFDDSAPSKSTIEYVRREHCIIPRDTKDIQSCLRLARAYEVTKHQLKLLAEQFGFDPQVTKAIEEHYKNKNTFIKLYKYFLRDDANYVYNAWLADPEVGKTDWLRAPMPHFLGDFEEREQTIDPITGQPIIEPPEPVPTTLFPIFAFPYRTQEDESILLVQGQAALSAHVQEALTGILTGTVNTCVRASGVYASRKPAPGNTPDNKELYPLKHGYVHDGDMDFFSLPWPNPVVLSVAQLLSVRNASQQGQTDFAAMSRNDTAKRATEIVAAKEEADKLKTARLALYSTKCLALYKVRFKILQKQIELNAIQLPPDLDPQVLLSPTLQLSMAADVQVVKREQRKNLLSQMWPLVATTPLAPVYFEAMISEIFPQDWPIWKQAMDQIQAQQQAAPMQMATQAMAAAYPSLPPDQQEVFRNVLNQLSPANGQPQPNPAGNPAQPVA